MIRFLNRTANFYVALELKHFFCNECRIQLQEIGRAKTAVNFGIQFSLFNCFFKSGTKSRDQTFNLLTIEASGSSARVLEAVREIT